MTGVAPSRRADVTVIAAWALATAAGAAVPAVLSLGTLVYLLGATPVGLPALWGAVGLAHWVAVRQLRIRAPGFGRGVVIGTLGGVSLTLTLIPFASSLNLPTLAVIGMAIAASGLGLGEGIALTEGLARRRRLLLLHVGASALGAAVGAALAIWVGPGTIGSDPSTAGLIGATALAAVAGATAYGLASGCTVAFIVRARPG